MTKIEDLSRPTIEVKIPQVRLQLKDLAFLRSLAQPDAVHCHVPENIKDRLRFLDLIAKANVPPSIEALRKEEKEEAEMIVILQKEIEVKDWSRAEQTCRSLRYAREKLVPRPQDVLTAEGEALLRTGEVTVRARKVGCV